ncbi:transcription factor subunit Med10 of mediator complex-domain-containing protein [Gigaspora rosea]|uniref:Mediator of RNA polymerase II transcription subunit 10 n=1 Tax=Gigaspora rosea TaxID=44941 RepID=A0A397US63_9GLOM|nr:transcription factor subunit Med10 of mediator complex-domain-containing protein [Gigaspora rosea]
MATVSEPRQQNGHSDHRAQLEQTIDQLLTKIWEIMVQLNEYDSENKTDLVACFEEVNKLQERIQHIQVPMKVIEFIDEGRNPDIFMADYVDEVMQENQAVKVKNEAIQGFREMLLEQLKETFPEQTNAWIRISNRISG